ncbi:TRAP transporter small permease [Rhodovulum sp. BSW8]|uniref:TRAP transporter small permease protein n=1 Tax=Rhodovulum visakhapatnamense TaxID=364297 RepID=A0A4R8FK38_9RHOB|nr:MULTISPECIES: TRAP transporter small permease [Rhodovulum]RBO54000.1 TRAP transporter small permease [Rhodovulum sp. BSW8]TDX24268.1 TRAP-type C4-dicarboxylate transport system permease small subunit [Rhodovulum visakhapatnamense]
MLTLIEKVLLLLRRLVSGVVILLFSVMMAAVLVQVAGRYVFNYSIAQASEVATFCQIWLVLLGAGVAMARGQHVAIDMIPARFSRPWARAALVFIALVSAAFLAVLAWGSQPLIRMGEFQTSPSLRVPMMYMYLCLPVGAAYIALELFLSVIQRWDDPFPPPSAGQEEEAI